MRVTKSNSLQKLGKFTVNKQEILEVQRFLDFFVGYRMVLSKKNLGSMLYGAYTTLS